MGDVRWAMSGLRLFRPQPAVDEPPIRTSLRVVWLAGLVYAVASSTHLGVNGKHLAASILTATTALGWIAWLIARQRRNLAYSLVSIVTLAVSGGVLVVLHPVGIAVIGIAGLCAGSLLDLVPAAVLSVSGVVASAIAVAVGGYSADLIGGAASGAAAGLVIGMGRREAQQRTRQEAELTVERERGEILAERNRIAREVHDVLAHTLSALSVQMEAMSSLLDDGASSAEVRDAVGRSRRLVTEGLEETRRAVRVLRDEPVDAAEQIAALAFDDGVTCQVNGSSRALPPATGLALVRVAQEALTNVRKHASGATVRVALCFGESATELTVDNDGAISASPLTDSGGGYGLQGMRERIELVGGTLTAGPDGASGWRVHAVVPA